jgi:ketosteroid isomerase-like protein
MSETSIHAAVLANMNSIKFAMAKDKVAWLALYAEDAVIADPVGVSPLDPQGKGHCGKAALENFWDNVIASANMVMTVHSRVTSGANACAVQMSAVNDVGNGSQTRVDMIATYEVDEAGKISSMKAYWNWEEMAAQLKQPGLM